MDTSKIQLYLNRARQDIKASFSNLEEGYYGVTVSRAYYAMFYATNALLISNGIERSKHSGVLSAFGEHFVKTGLIESEYAKMLGHAFSSRLDSDYDIAFLSDELLAEEIAESAQKFIDRIEQYLQEEEIL